MTGCQDDIEVCLIEPSSSLFVHEEAQPQSATTCKHVVPAPVRRREGLVSQHAREFERNPQVNINSGHMELNLTREPISQQGWSSCKQASTLQARG
jgi:hypothetical protein